MVDYSSFAALTHGTSGLVLSFLGVWVPMLVALVRTRAPFKSFVRSPLAAAVLTTVASIVIAAFCAVLQRTGIEIPGAPAFLIGVGAVGVLGYWVGLRSPFGEDGGAGTYRRGAVVSADAGRRRVRRPGGESDRTCLTLAGIPLSPDDEVKHFKFIGTTGTGKSTAIREILSTALARGDRAVIADPDGGYLGNFYDAARGDVILNPFDPDSRKWNLLDEITADYDVDQLACSLIPENGTSDRSWIEYARTVFTAVVQQSIAARVKDDAEIYRLISQASVEELKLLLKGTVGGPFLEQGNERMFGSVRSVTMAAVRALKYTTQQRATPFSVRQWVRQGAARQNGGPGGVLFFPYRAGEIAALRSSISAWMRLAIFEAMDGPERDQRLWFVVDELDALGEIDGLKDALPRLRKFGGRCVLGFQSISQVSSTYGKGVANTIVENCGNTLILRCSAGEQGGTAHFASRLIGQREVVHTTLSKTRRPSDFLSSRTTSEHRTIESAVMDSEIERLPDLAGFLKLASTPDWIRMKLSYVTYPVVFQQRRPESSVGEAPLTPVVPEATAPATPPPGPAKARARRPPRKSKAQQERHPPSSPTVKSSPPTDPAVPVAEPADIDLAVRVGLRSESES
jgi:type IV secretory pathway TraG/TraD family ATPase VirD4